MWLDVHIHREAKYYKAYLNGEYLKYCFAANEEEGWADCHKIDEGGKCILNEDETETLKERFYGEVKLIKVIDNSTWEDQLKQNIETSTAIERARMKL